MTQSVTELARRESEEQAGGQAGPDAGRTSLGELAPATALVGQPVPNITLATAVADVQHWLAGMGSPPFVAVDTETAGWDAHRDPLLLVQVAAGPDRPVLVLDTAHVDPRALRPLLADAGVLKVFHHGAFDLRFLAAAGLSATRVADTMLAQQLLDGGARTATGNGLADLAAFRVGMTLDKSVRETFAGGGAMTDTQIRYAADDAAATWAVFDQQWRELVGHGLVRVARLEFAALPVLADLARRGVAFDAPRWLGLVGELEARLPQLEATLQAALVTDDSPHDLFGPTPVNLESPEQIIAALARLGIEVNTTRESVLRDHAQHPAVAALLEYRQVAKVVQNWGGDWAARVAHPATGRVHGDWRQITGPGRIACSEPNLMQIPKQARYRACFGGVPGRTLVVADYSQQELRILAAVSGDDALAEVFAGHGDLHRRTAAMVFDVAEDAVSPTQRAAAKALNFGLMYGMGAASFARSTGMDLATAKSAIERYFTTFPRVRAWLEQAEATGRRSGRVRTALGRIHVLDVEAPGGVARVSRNAPIQGSGADMTKLALAAVAQRLAARFPSASHGGPDGLVLVVHDELVVEVDEADAPEAAALVEDGMLEAAREVLGEVPAVVDVSLRPRWGDVEAANP